MQYSYNSLTVGCAGGGSSLQNKSVAVLQKNVFNTL